MPSTTIPTASPAPAEATVRLFGKDITPQQATKVLFLHHEAFSNSACTSCPGICCKDCAQSDGYLHRDDVPYDTIQKLKRKFGFNRKTGFKSETGCSLPLHLRSTVCAAFYCETSSPGNTYTRKVLAERKATLGPLPKVDTLYVAFNVEALHDYMREVYA